MKRNVVLFFVCATFIAGCSSENKIIDESNIQNVMEITEESAVFNETEIKTESKTDRSISISETSINSDLYVFDELNIKEYNYSSAFTIDLNLQKMMEAVVAFGGLEQGFVENETYQSEFIDMMISNLSAECEYGEKTAKDNQGKLTKRQIEYLQYSFSGEYIAFTDLAENEMIEYSTRSFFSSAELVSYEANVEHDFVTVSGIMNRYVTGSTMEEAIQFEAILKKNPYSCFDGYSICALTLEESAQISSASGEELYIEGYLVGEEDVTENECCLIELQDYNGDISYNNYIEISLYGHKEFVDLINSNKTSKFRFSYVYDEGMGYVIGSISPNLVEILNE